MEIRKFKSRHYLFQGKKRIKMIPKRFAEIPASILASMLNDEEKLYLNKKERFELEFYDFLQELKDSEKYLYELICNSKPIEAIHVNVKEGDSRKELKFKNGYRVKISQTLFNLFDTQTTMYSYQ